MITKEQVKNYIKSNLLDKKGNLKNTKLILKNQEILKFTNEYIGKTLPEKIYFIFNDLIDYPICPICGNKITKFETFKTGFKRFCSLKCSSNSQETKNKIKETCKSRYRSR